MGPKLPTVLIASPKLYRLSVIGCALDWLAVGLFLFSTLQSIIERDRVSWSSVAMLVLFAFMGVLSVKTLLSISHQIPDLARGNLPAA